MDSKTKSKFSKVLDLYNKALNEMNKTKKPSKVKNKFDKFLYLLGVEHLSEDKQIKIGKEVSRIIKHNKLYEESRYNVLFELTGVDKMNRETQIEVRDKCDEFFQDYRFHWLAMKNTKDSKSLHEMYYSKKSNNSNVTKFPKDLLNWDTHNSNSVNSMNESSMVNFMNWWGVRKPLIEIDETGKVLSSTTFQANIGDVLTPLQVDWFKVRGATIKFTKTGGN